MLENCFHFKDPSLVSRLIDGKCSGRYKAENYEKLKAITQIKNAAGHQSLQKILSIHQFSKEKKELNTLQQHKTFWKKELIHLNGLYEENKNELKMVQNGLPWEQNLMKEFFDEVEEYEDFMEEDYLRFSKNTVQPVWDLMEDIRIWLEENKSKIITGIYIYLFLILKNSLCAIFIIFCPCFHIIFDEKVRSIT